MSVTYQYYVYWGSKTKWNILEGIKHLIFYIYLETKIKIRYIFRDEKLI